MERVVQVQLPKVFMRSIEREKESYLMSYISDLERINESTSNI